MLLEASSRSMVYRAVTIRWRLVRGAPRIRTCQPGPQRAAAKESAGDPNERPLERVMEGRRGNGGPDRPVMSWRRSCVRQLIGPTRANCSCTATRSSGPPRTLRMPSRRPASRPSAACRISSGTAPSGTRLYWVATSAPDQHIRKAASEVVQTCLEHGRLKQRLHKRSRSEKIVRTRAEAILHPWRDRAPLEGVQRHGGGYRERGSG